MLSAGYKPTDQKKKKKKQLGEAGGAWSPRREGQAEGWETLNSQECLINTGTIPYLFTSSALSGFRVVSTSC